MTDAMITALLEHIFQNENMPGLGDATGLRSSSLDGYFYFGLHTADPKEYDAEVSYTGYTRVAVQRSPYGFTVAGNRASNYSDIQFPERLNTGTTTATHFGIHYESTGEGNLFASEELAVPLVITQGVLPPYGPGNMIMEFNRV